MTKTPQLFVDGGSSLNPLSKVALTPILNAFNEDPESAYSALPWLDKNKEIRQQIRDMLFDVESQYESDEIHFWSIVHDESKEFVGLIGLGDELQLLHSNYNLGYCYFQIADYSNAVKWFRSYEKVVNDSMKLIDTYLRIADSYFMISDFSLSAQYYEKAADLNFFDIDYALYQHSVSLGLIGKDVLKIGVLRKIITDFSYSSYYDNALHDLAVYYK